MDPSDDDVQLRALVDALAEVLTAEAEPPASEVLARLEVVADAFLARFGEPGTGSP